MTRAEFHTKAYFICCLLIAFFLPVFNRIVPVFIGLLVINWLAEGNFREKIQSLAKNKLIWLMILLYLAYGVGMLWTENSSSGWFDLQVKLSILIFPLIIGSSGKGENGFLKKVLWGFVAGCMVAGVICYSVAFWHFFKTGENHFIYTYFSVNMHPSYAAMYQVFAIAFILFSIDLNGTFRSELKSYLAIFFLISVVLFLASKVGTIALMILILIYVVYISYHSKKYLPAILFFSFAAAITLSVFHFFPYSLGRLQTGLSVFSQKGMDLVGSDDSNAARILVWKSDIRLINEYFLSGVGTGDVKDKLMEKYQEYGYSFLTEHRLNAHSQIFQTFIAIGFLGFLILMVNFIFPFIRSMKGKKYLYLAFLLIIIANFLVESMLETQAGVMFYAFFNSLLLRDINS